MTRRLSPPADGAIDESAHLVQFYEHDEFLIEALARFIGAGLGAGDAAGKPDVPATLPTLH